MALGAYYYFIYFSLILYLGFFVLLAPTFSGFFFHIFLVNSDVRNDKIIKKEEKKENSQYTNQRGYLIHIIIHIYIFCPVHLV